MDSVEAIMENVKKQAAPVSRLARSSFDLTGKVAVVTGSGRGMGEAIAKGLAELGAVVVSSDINLESAQATADAIAAAGHEACAMRIDISNEAVVESFVDAVVSKYGKLDIWVNNAAILDVGSRSFPEMTVEGFKRTIEVNLTGVFICSRYAAMQMVKQNSGSIINIGSNSSRGAVMNVAWGSPAYAASKGAIHTLTASIAQNLAKYNVRCNCVAPAAVDTPMHAHHRQWLLETYNNLIPLGRVMVADDVVGAVAFLASDASGFVTGQSLHVNGGMLMVQ